MVPHCGFDLRFPKNSNVEHVSMCLLVTYMSYLEKYLVKAFAHFAVGLFVFLLLSHSSLYILVINPLKE